MMVGIEVVLDKKTKAMYPLERKIGAAICGRAIKQGVIIRPLGHIIVLMPPLSITKAEIEKLLKVVFKAICEETQI